MPKESPVYFLMGKVKKKLPFYLAFLRPFRLVFVEHEVDRVLSVVDFVLLFFSVKICIPG